MLKFKNNYMIKNGYKSNLNNLYYTDEPNRFTYQPDVYKLAMYLIERGDIKYIIDIGSGNGNKLKDFIGKTEIICIDYGENEILLKNTIPSIRFYEANLEKYVPHIDDEILKNSVVVCCDVVEHIRKPKILLNLLKEYSYKAPFVLISTPERIRSRGVESFGPPENPCHVREWSIDEFNSLLRKYNYNNFMIGYTINTDYHLSKSTILAITGTHIYHKTKKTKKILAVINMYNEEDIIEETIIHLLSEGIDVHVVDNWSTDNSYNKVREIANKQPDRVYLSRYPEVDTGKYEWGNLLKNTVKIGSDSDYDWIMHNDADELRISPWKNVSMREAISYIDELGYNSIDFTVLDFRTIENEIDNNSIQSTKIFFEFGKRPGHFVQIKAWKNQTGTLVDLSSTGGHHAMFNGQKVYPIKFIMKHYPLRSQQQAQKKIFEDRKIRFVNEEYNERKWHRQYDQYNEKTNFIWEKKSLNLWSSSSFYNEYLVEYISGIGIVRE